MQCKDDDSVDMFELTIFLRFFSVKVISFTGRCLNIAAETLKANYGQVSLRTFVRILKLLTHCCRRVLSIAVLVVLAVETTLISLEK